MSMFSHTFTFDTNTLRAKIQPAANAFRPAIVVAGAIGLDNVPDLITNTGLGGNEPFNLSSCHYDGDIMFKATYRQKETKLVLEVLY